MWQDGETLYSSDFIAQYLLPVLYPGNLTIEAFSCSLGTGVVVLNAVIYWWLWREPRGKRS